MLPALFQFTSLPSRRRIAPVALAVTLALTASATAAANTDSAGSKDRDLQRWPALKSAVPVDKKLEQRLEKLELFYD